MHLSILRFPWFVCLAFILSSEPLAGAELTAPAPQADYTVREIDFRAHDGVAMFGKLALPGSNAPRAVVIYVQTAEGATVDMKRPLGNGKTFNYHDLYRTKLTEMNIGFFSYEGRGIRMGEHPPRYEEIDWKVYNTSTLENKVRDVWSAIDAVRGQEGLQKIPVLLMGASEGTLLAAEAAARKPGLVSGLVLYGVLVSNLRETFTYIMSEGDFLRFRSLDLDHDAVITRSEWDRVIKGQEFEKADLNGDGGFTLADVKVATKKYLDAIETDDFEVLQAWAKASAGMSVPEGWFKDHFNHADNWTFLSKLKIPVGCFHGDADNMTPIAAVRDLEAKARKADLTLMEFRYFAGLDHTLNIAQYFAKGKLPEGHQAIFQFIDRVVR